MPAIDVVADANVVLKWFHAAGEEGVEAARALVTAHQDRTLALGVLDLTAYEVGTALLRGGARATPGQVSTVLEALADICPVLTPTPEQRARAVHLADEHDLTLYDAAYAAVAEGHGAALATFDDALLGARLGIRPDRLLGSGSRPGE